MFFASSVKRFFPTEKRARKLSDLTTTSFPERTANDDGKYSFRFLITTVSSADGESHSAYIVYNAETDTELTDDRWQKIMLDGYATATLVDFYGRVYKVNYMLIEEGGRTVLRLYGSTLGNRYYAVDFQTKTFTETVDGDAAA